MKKVFGFYLKPYYWRMFGGFVIKFFGTIMDLLIPWVLAYIIDNVVPTGKLSHVFLWEKKKIAGMVKNRIVIIVNRYFT